MKKTLVIFCLLIIFFHINVYAIDSDKIYYAELKNKATMVVVKDSNKSDFTNLNFYIRVSPALENKSNAGISRVLCNLVIQNMIKLDSMYANTKLIFHDEYTQFQFVLPNKEIEIERVISNIYRNILLDSSCFDNAKKVAIDELKYTSSIDTETINFQNKINNALWGEYTYKKAQDMTNSSISNIKYNELKKFHERYFRTYYSLFIVKANYNAKAKFQDIDNNILYDESLNSTYIPISVLNIYNNLNTSAQFVMRDTLKTNQEKTVLSYQLASNYQENNGYIKSTIVEQVLNHFSSALFDSIGISPVKSFIKLYKNATVFNIEIDGKSLNKKEFYNIKSILDNIDFTKILTKEKLIQILKSELNRFSIENQQTNTLEENLVENWSLNKIDDFFNYDKKVKNINIDDVAYFYDNFIKNRPFVIYTNTYSENSANQIAEIYESKIKDLQLLFNYNISDITKESEILKVEAVKQWMYINPNAYLQVNGFADKNEYLKVSTSEIDSFVKMYPKFNLMSSFKNKSSWKRLDVIRALKICKYLIESGINPDRINGSGVLLNSDEPENMKNNQKVTFTIYTIR